MCACEFVYAGMLLTKGFASLQGQRSATACTVLLTDLGSRRTSADIPCIRRTFVSGCVQQFQSARLLWCMFAQVSAHRQAAADLLGAHDAGSASAALRELQHAPKLAALRDILVTCGVVAGGEEAEGRTQSHTLMYVRMSAEAPGLGSSVCMCIGRESTVFRLKSSQHYAHCQARPRWMAAARIVLQPITSNGQNCFVLPDAHFCLHLSFCGELGSHSLISAQSVPPSVACTSEWPPVFVMAANALPCLLPAGAVSGGGSDDVVLGGSGAAGSSGHRLLVFAQTKAMLDLTERDLLQVCVFGLGAERKGCTLVGIHWFVSG